MGNAVGNWLIRVVVLAGLVSLYPVLVRAQDRNENQNAGAANSEADTTKIPVETRPPLDVDQDPPVEPIRVQSLLHKPRLSDADQKQIQDFTKWQVDRLSDPRREGTVAKDARDIVNYYFRRARGPGRDEYRKALLQDLPDLLGSDGQGRYFKMIVRLNAAVVLASLDTEDATGLLCAVIGDDNQAPAVKYWAIRGIDLLVTPLDPDRHFHDTANEVKAVKALVGLLTNRNLNPNPVVRWAAVKTLGDIRRPSTDAQSPNARPNVAQLLLQVLDDPTEEWRTRSAAALSLGLLQVWPGMQFNFHLVADRLGRYMVELANKAKADPKNREQAWLIQLYDVWEAFTGVQPLKGKSPSGLVAQLDQAIQASPQLAPVRTPVGEISDLANRIMMDAKDNLKSSPGRLSDPIDALARYLDKNPPKSKKMSDDLPELARDPNPT